MDARGRCVLGGRFTCRCSGLFCADGRFDRLDRKPNYPGRASHVRPFPSPSPPRTAPNPPLPELRKSLYSSPYPPFLPNTPLQNAGFLIPPTFRGLKIGKTLGKSYLIYGPKLGYRGSVFNLVFKSTFRPPSHSRQSKY